MFTQTVLNCNTPACFRACNCCMHPSLTLNYSWLLYNSLMQVLNKRQISTPNRSLNNNKAKKVNGHLRFGKAKFIIYKHNKKSSIESKCKSQLQIDCESSPKDELSKNIADQKKPKEIEKELSRLCKKLSRKQENAKMLKQEEKKPQNERSEKQCKKLSKKHEKQKTQKNGQILQKLCNNLAKLDKLKKQKNQLDKQFKEMAKLEELKKLCSKLADEAPCSLKNETSKANDISKAVVCTKDSSKTESPKNHGNEKAQGQNSDQMAYKGKQRHKKNDQLRQFQKCTTRKEFDKITKREKLIKHQELINQSKELNQRAQWEMKAKQERLRKQLLVQTQKFKNMINFYKLKKQCKKVAAEMKLKEEKVQNKNVINKKSFKKVMPRTGYWIRKEKYNFMPVSRAEQKKAGEKLKEECQKIAKQKLVETKCSN